MHRPIEVVALASLLVATAGCYNVLPSSGGAQARFEAPREVHASDVALPAGYRIEAVATELTFPTGIAFDEQGVPHVIEAGYSYGEVWTQPRLLRLDADGTTREIARGGGNGPWTGVAFANGAFFIAEGGTMEGGRVLRVEPDGRTTPLIQGLPSQGDHHTNGPAIDSAGRIYFAVGTATNSGVVGKDNLEFGWLRRFPRFHDVPCADVELTGVNFESPSLLPGSQEKGSVRTGAFLPFGTPAQAGQVIQGRLPCSGAVMSIRPDGSDLALEAHGLRNPFGLAFGPDGGLYVTENGFDDRGSRPIWGAGDVLWRIQPGAWYGWPDFAEGRSVANAEFRPPGSPQPDRMLVPSGMPPRPVAVLGVHASADGLDFSRSEAFGHVGQAFIAEFGDQSPRTGKSLHPVGFRIVRVDVTNGRIEVFATNKGRAHGPASKIGGGGLERPVAVRFNPSGDALYVVDFGVLTEHAGGSFPQRKTGVVWRISEKPE